MPHRPRFLSRRRSAPLLPGGALLAALLLAVPATPLFPEPAAALAYAQPGPPLQPGPAAGQPSPYEAHPQLDQLGAEEVWEHSTGRDVIVAVIDSGVDASHPALAGRVLAGADFVDGSTDGREDPAGHGTTVASLIVGRGPDSAADVIGLAPDATILPVRVLDGENRYQTAATVAEGVVWAVEQGAQVINLSLGGARPSPALSEALDLAMDNNVVVVACTGNAGDDPDAAVWYPAREPGVVAVSGMTWGEDGSPAGWPESLTGPETVLTAPAVVTGADADGGFRRAQGTSFSAALVAAAAALILARWPELPAADVVTRLVATADSPGTRGRDAAFGFGVVDPLEAVTAQVPQVPVNPLDTTVRQGAAGLGAAP